MPQTSLPHLLILASLWLPAHAQVANRSHPAPRVLYKPRPAYAGDALANDIATGPAT